MEGRNRNNIHSVENLLSDVIESEDGEGIDISDRNALREDISQEIPGSNYYYDVKYYVAVRAEEKNSKTGYWIGKAFSTSSNARGYFPLWAFTGMNPVVKTRPSQHDMNHHIKKCKCGNLGCTCKDRIQTSMVTVSFARLKRTVAFRQQFRSLFHERIHREVTLALPLTRRKLELFRVNHCRREVREA